MRSMRVPSASGCCGWRICRWPSAGVLEAMALRLGRAALPCPEAWHRELNASTLVASALPAPVGAGPIRVGLQRAAVLARVWTPVGCQEGAAEGLRLRNTIVAAVSRSVRSASRLGATVPPRRHRSCPHADRSRDPGSTCTVTGGLPHTGWCSTTSLAYALKRPHEDAC